jgi:hypothetical protein
MNDEIKHDLPLVIGLVIALIISLAVAWHC